MRLGIGTQGALRRVFNSASLGLDFISGVLDSRVTFTRASKGWATNSSGLIAEYAVNAPRFDYDPVTLAPKGLLIEEARTNLLTYSSRFDNAAWVKDKNQFRAGAGIAPDGTLSAQYILETGNGLHQTYQAVTATAVPHTFSIYVKASGRDWIAIRFDDGSAQNAWFNVSTGVKGTINAAYTSSSITNEGNGWFRCSVTRTATAATWYAVVHPASADGTVTYNADGTLGLYIWGAVIEAGAFATSYIPSTDSFTSRASTATSFDSAGVMQTAAINVPRYGFAYDSASGTWVSTGLILEAAATNLLLNSATLVTQDITTTAAARTLSFYGTGTVTLSGTHSATVVGTGAYPTSRTTYTYTPTAGTLTLTVTGTVVYAQDELGSVATSWISTAGAAVTRAADVSSSAATTRAVSDAVHTIAAMVEGTVVVEYQANASGTRPILSFDDNSANNSIVLRTVGTDPKFTVTNGGAAQADIDAGTVASGTFYKIAAAWKVNDFAASVNGAAVVADTSGAIPTFDRMRLGGNQAGDKLNGAIRSVRVYATRLPDATLQALTA